MKWDEDADEGTSNSPIKKKNKQWCEGSLVAAADRRGGRKPVEGTPNHFKKLLKGPCPNHDFPVKHLYKDCSLKRRFLSGGSNKGEHRKDPDPIMDDCLMIFRGPEAYDS